MKSSLPGQVLEGGTRVGSLVFTLVFTLLSLEPRSAAIQVSCAESRALSSPGSVGIKPQLGLAVSGTLQFLCKLQQRKKERSDVDRGALDLTRVAQTLSQTVGFHCYTLTGWRSNFDNDAFFYLLLFH